MNKSLILASLVAAFALAACGKKEEVVAPMPAPVVVTPAPAPMEAASAASAPDMAASVPGTAASR